MLKRKSRLNLADIAVEKRNLKNDFLREIDKIVDWKIIEDKINKSYSKGQRIDGRPAYPGILLFRMCMLEEWYTIYHSHIDYYVNDSICFTHFVGLSLDDEVPSHTTVSRFRQELIHKGLYDELKDLITRQLEGNKLRIRKGTLKQAAILH